MVISVIYQLSWGLSTCLDLLSWGSSTGHCQGLTGHLPVFTVHHKNCHLGVKGHQMWKKIWKVVTCLHLLSVHLLPKPSTWQSGLSCREFCIKTKILIITMGGSVVMSCDCFMLRRSVCMGQDWLHHLSRQWSTNRMPNVHRHLFQLLFIFHYPHPGEALDT